MVIGAFAGLRTSEIFRLEWSHFRWDERDQDDKPAPYIALTDEVAFKTKTPRIVPLLPNRVAYLDRWRHAFGPLYANIETHGQGRAWKTLEDDLGAELKQLRKSTGLRTKINGLRHSFGSHRLAVTKSYAQVALEMGNTPVLLETEWVFEWVGEKMRG